MTFLRYLSLKFGHPELARGPQKHAFRKVSSAEMHFAPRFAIITQKLAPTGSSKDSRDKIIFALTYWVKIYNLRLSPWGRTFEL